MQIKKTGILLFIVGFGVVLIGAVPYYSGYFIKNKVLEVVNILNTYTAHKTELVSYSRGWRHSSAVMKIALSNNMLKFLCANQENSGKNYLVIENKFAHGPLVRMQVGDSKQLMTAHALIDARIIGFEGSGICPDMKALEKQIIDKDLVVMNGKIALNGDLSMSMKKKPLEYVNNEVGFTLKTEGEETKFKLTNQSRHFEVMATVPSLSIEIPKKQVLVTLKALALNMEKNYEEKIWTGESHYTVSNVHFKVNNTDTNATTTGTVADAFDVELMNMDFGDMVKLNDHLVNAAVTFNIAGIKTGQEQYGPINMMFSVNKLTQPFYSKMIELMITSRGEDLAKHVQQYEEEIKKLLPDVLKNEPEVVLNKLAITMPKGHFALNGKMIIGGEGATDIDRIDLIMASIRAMKHAEIDDSLFREGLTKYYDMIAKTAPETVWTLAQTTPEKWVPAKVQEMIDKIVHMGFLVPKDNKFIMDLTFEKMQTMVNGKPFVMPSPEMFMTELPKPVEPPPPPPVPAAVIVPSPAPAVSPIK